MTSACIDPPGILIASISRKSPQGARLQLQDKLLETGPVAGPGGLARKLGRTRERKKQTGNPATRASSVSVLQVALAALYRHSTAVSWSRFLC